MARGLIIFGFGYCANNLLQNSNDWDGNILVVTRSHEKISFLRKRGIEVCHWSDKDYVKEWLKKTVTILVSVPPVGNTDPVIESFADFFSELPKRSKFIYLSSTGVYGDHQGNWVNESSSLKPKTQLGIYRLNAERAWKNLVEKFGVKLIIMRLAGIYGPGRSPIEKLQKGEARVIRKPGLLFSRIHIDDIVGLIKLCLERDDIFGTYNICDNKPASSETVIKEAARLIDVDFPEPISPEKLSLSKVALGFYSESKKVSNKKLLEDFRYRMKYPDYVSGLKAIVDKLKSS